jgi:hypothetical protein
LLPRVTLNALADQNFIGQSLKAIYDAVHGGGE